MSAEFEKIVLEKFDELNSKINGLSEELHETKENVNNLSKKVDNLEEKVDNNTTSINNLSLKIEQVEEKVDQQGLNFAKFENDFNIKIQGLFDSFVANTENHLAYDKFISALNAKTYNHDNRISILEDHFKDTKLLAAN